MLIIRLNGCHHSTVPDGTEWRERWERGNRRGRERERERGRRTRERYKERGEDSQKERSEEVEVEKEREKLASFNNSQTKGDFQRNVGRESRRMPEAHSRQISEGEREKK